ncbi:hypothetical protein [Vulcanisaeta sp. JCM 16161]|uniref:hypothetical protein n=1 Tax=Vulcanisaeta sp. JCM 16161 TaxID=1295372 RepID=UPI000AACDB40|nr:hypothetical protein [Vulcanisaeta sp. JCM 16161]
MDNVHFLGTIYMAYRSNERLLAFVNRYGFKVIELTKVNRDQVFAQLSRVLGSELSKRQ